MELRCSLQPTTPRNRILLIHAPFNPISFGAEWRPTESLAAPLGLMYLAAPLIEAGYKVTFVDLNVDRLERKEFLDMLRNADFVLISCYSDSLRNVEAIIKITRSTNESAVIVCGGPYCNWAQRYIKGATLVVVGEAEDHIVEIIDRVRSRNPVDDIPGLIYQKDQIAVRNPGILQTRDISKSRHASLLLSQGKNYGCFFGHRIRGLSGVMSSRGCPFSCTFCTHKGLIPYRKRSVENVVAELKEMESHGVKYVVFYDDNFLMDKQRALQIMRRIMEEGIRLKMVVQGRVDSADPEFYRTLRRAGVVMILFGIETINQDVLDFYQKGITSYQITRAIELCDRAGMVTFGYFILGSPLETTKHFEETRRFLQTAPLDYINVNVLGYYQGSKLWRDAVAAGLIRESETVVYANERLSGLPYHGWISLKNKLLDEFYTKGRVARVLWKILRLGFLNVFLEAMWYGRGGVIKKIRDPFISDNALKIVVD